MISRLGNLQPFFPEGSALSEHAALGKTHDEDGTGEHSGQDSLTEALLAQRPVETRHASA